MFENNKYVFCVMEYAPNGDLLSYLKKKQLLDEEKAKYIFYQIALAIKFLHELNIIHWDIKLDNILVDENHHCKLSDFGVSRFIEKGEVVHE